MAEKHIAIVLAGGRGSRMNNSVPKQYMTLLDRPVLYYSLKCMEDSFIDHIILVCGRGEEEYCRLQFAEGYGFRKICRIVAGGQERYDSVYNGLLCGQELAPDPENTYIYIHDGARPCIDGELLAECRENVRKYHGCVPSVPVKDTIKVADGEGFAQNTPDRSRLRAVQTPQCFRFDIAFKAYSLLKESGEQQECGITDDAMVVERFVGGRIKLCQGSYNNIKITTPEDLSMAENILKSTQTADCKIISKK